MADRATDYAWVMTGLRLTDGPWVEFAELYDRLTEDEKNSVRAEARERGMVILNDLSEAERAKWLDADDDEES